MQHLPPWGPPQPSLRRHPGWQLPAMCGSSSEAVDNTMEGLADSVMYSNNN